MNSWLYKYSLENLNSKKSLFSLIFSEEETEEGLPHAWTL